MIFVYIGLGIAFCFCLGISCYCVGYDRGDRDGYRTAHVRLRNADNWPKGGIT